MTDERLRKPRRKAKSGLHMLESSFPVPIETITGKQATDTHWYYYFGTLQENCVVISRIGDLTFLYRLGFFGKGMLSRSRPQFEKYGDVLSEYSRKQYSYRLSMLEPKSRKQCMRKYGRITRERLRQHETWSVIKTRLEKKKAKEVAKQAEQGRTQEGNCRLLQCEDLHTFVDDGIVEECSTDGEDDNFLDKLHEYDKCMEDQDSETEIARSTETTFSDKDQKISNDLKRCHSLGALSEEAEKWIKLEDPSKLYECLALTFEEAFFLSYGLGCLGITNENPDDQMNLNEMWKAFRKRKPRFVEMYVAYHYFRSKGWVVRFGNMYGADLALYKDGMPFYHASYSVYVQLVSEDGLRMIRGSELTWRGVSSMSRVNEKVAKEVVMCYVVQPKDLLESEFDDLSCIGSFQIIELVLRRWIPEKHREFKSGIL